MIRTNSKVLAQNIITHEALISKKREDQVIGIIEKLKQKASLPDKKQYKEVKVSCFEDTYINRFSKHIFCL